MTISYLRIKRATHPQKPLEREGEELCLSPQLESLLKKFVAPRANPASTAVTSA